MIGALGAGLIAGYGVALPVGPIATYLVSLGAREQLRTATAAALGVATTDGLFAAIAAFSGTRLQTLLRPIAQPLTAASVIVLILLAIRTLITAAKRHRATTREAVSRAKPPGPLRAYTGLVALTALNSTTVAYFSALVLGDHPKAIGATAFSAGLFAIGALVASASWQLVITGSGAVLGRLLTGPRGQLLVAIVSATIMFTLAARLLTS